MEEEPERNGFKTLHEVHPIHLVEGGSVAGAVGIKELREAIPAYCFEQSLCWSSFYLLRDLTYSFALIFAFQKLLSLPQVAEAPPFYYLTVILYGFLQGLVWTGLWVIAHECGHSAFSKYSAINDTLGFILHSALLAPYFSWKSTHRRHHIYAGHMEKDHNYVPLLRNEYASKTGVNSISLEELGEDAPVVVLLRILLQQLIGWNWYIISNITCPPTALVKQGMNAWRNSHFDPWGSLYRSSEAISIILSDIGCLATFAVLYALYVKLGSFEKVFWLYLVPWSWVNHWIVMITYLHHTHPSVPKYRPSAWSFIRGATATIDRDFGIIGTHFFHNISSDHVTHHLFSKMPHYNTRVATLAMIPLLGKHYHARGTFGYSDLHQAFTQCQWVEEDLDKDRAHGLAVSGRELPDGVLDSALWYRGGRSPPVEYRMRDPKPVNEGAVDALEKEMETQ